MTSNRLKKRNFLERETGIEPVTSSLGIFRPRYATQCRSGVYKGEINACRIPRQLRHLLQTCAIPLNVGSFVGNFVGKKFLQDAAKRTIILLPIGYARRARNPRSKRRMRSRDCCARRMAACCVRSSPSANNHVKQKAVLCIAGSVIVPGLDSLDFGLRTNLQYHSRHLFERERLSEQR